MSNEETDKPRVIPKIEGDVSPYEVLPAEPAVPTPPPATKGKLEGPRFIDTVDDDADLEDIGDTAEPAKPAATAGVAARGAFVEAGRGDAAIIGAIGGGACVVACVCAAVFATGSKFPAAVLGLLQVALLTGTGIVSLGITAHLIGKSFGDVALGAARMLLAVSLGVLWLKVRVTGGPRVLEPVLAAAFYFVTLWVLMRKNVRDIAKVAVFHFVLGALMLGSLFVYAWAQAASTAGAVK